MANLTPVALFTYNRPQHAQRALAALARCDRLSETRVHIYCDGVNKPEHAEGVNATRQVVHDWASANKATVIERSENLGLAHSIVTGVSDLCKTYGRVIVVEDDLVVSPDFLNYMLQALDRYQDDPKVYQISGFMFPVTHTPAPDALFLPLTTTWGWATWERAWRIFDWEATGALKSLADPDILRTFNLDGAYPYATMLRRRLEARNDSWGILWWWAVFNIGGLVLHPRQSLVWNGGFDNSGVHSGASLKTYQSPREIFDQPRLSTSLNFPSQSVVDDAAFDRIKAYLHTQSSGRFLGSGALRRLMQILKHRQSRRHLPIDQER
jgi:hypothetical protein